MSNGSVGDELSFSGSYESQIVHFPLLHRPNLVFIVSPTMVVRRDTSVFRIFFSFSTAPTTLTFLLPFRTLYVPFSPVGCRSLSSSFLSPTVSDSLPFRV